MAIRLSRYLIATLREAPSDADNVSAQLMQRAGMIRKVASGIYDWLPLGLVLFLGAGKSASELGALFTIAICSMWPTVLNTATAATTTMLLSLVFTTFERWQWPADRGRHLQGLPARRSSLLLIGSSPRASLRIGFERPPSGGFFYRPRAFADAPNAGIPL